MSGDIAAARRGRKRACNYHRICWAAWGVLPFPRGIFLPQTLHLGQQSSSDLWTANKLKIPKTRIPSGAIITYSWFTNRLLQSTALFCSCLLKSDIVSTPLFSYEVTWIPGYLVSCLSQAQGCHVRNAVNWWCCAYSNIPLSWFRSVWIWRRHKGSQPIQWVTA